MWPPPTRGPSNDAPTTHPRARRRRKSPALFLLILILGAVAVQWINTQAWQHPIDDDAPADSRPDENEGDPK